MGINLLELITHISPTNTDTPWHAQNPMPPLTVRVKLVVVFRFNTFEVIDNNNIHLLDPKYDSRSRNTKNNTYREEDLQVRLTHVVDQFPV